MKTKAMIKTLSSILVTLFTIIWSASTLAIHVTELIPTRDLIPDVQPMDLDVDGEPFVQRYHLVHSSDDAVATIVLLVGGVGVIRFTEDERFSGRWMMSVLAANFLVRSRYLFGAEGLNVVLADAATDFALSTRLRSNNRLVGLRGWRFTEEYLSDLEDLIADLRHRFGKPIWLIGTSRGTNGAASAAAQLPLPFDDNSPPTGPDRPDGIVLTSSVTRGGENNLYFLSGIIDLASIDIPVMVTAHVDDGCEVTPPEDTDDIASMLVNSPKVKIKFFDGGTNPISGPCDALSAHGYFGIEPEVVQEIGEFIQEMIEE